MRIHFSLAQTFPTNMFSRVPLKMKRVNFVFVRSHFFFFLSVFVSMLYLYFVSDLKNLPDFCSDSCNQLNFSCIGENSSNISTRRYIFQENQLALFSPLLFLYRSSSYFKVWKFDLKKSWKDGRVFLVLTIRTLETLDPTKCFFPPLQCLH